MSINWVMLTRDGRIVPKPDEKILHTTRARVALDLSIPQELRVADPFSLRSDSGVAYITNERIIYLPARPTESFKSFFAPILNFYDSHVQSSWGGIGPWSWTGMVKPVSGGGIPAHIPRIEAKLTFKDGGHQDFQNKFEWLKERLSHAREMGLVPSQNIEPPPPYEPAVEIEPSSEASTATVPAPVGESSSASEAQQVLEETTQETPQPGPDEPPPDYVEAQAQAIAMQYEDRVREEAEREG